MSKCLYCSRRGNRVCTAVKMEICSRCCGRLRRTFIQCSDGCEYLLESRKAALEKLLNIYGDSEFERDWFEVLHNLRLAIIKTKSSPFPNDDEIIAALENVIERRRIQEKGLIYAPKSVNPNVQLLVSGLERILSHYEKMGTTHAAQYESSQLNTCLKYILRQVRTAKIKGVDIVRLISGVVGMNFVNIDATISSSKETVS